MKPTAKKKPRAMAAKSASGARIKNPGKGIKPPESADSSGASEMLLLLDKAIQTTKTGITFCDRDNIIQYTNPADAEMHGYGVAELIGQDVSIFSPSGKKRSMTFDDMKAIKSWARESVNRKKDGTLFPVYLISDVVKNDRGEPIGVVTVCEDITERKRAEETLRESEEKFRNLAEESPNMIFINRRGSVVYANRNCEKLMGYSREEFYSPDFDFRSLVAPEHRGLIEENLSSHMTGEDVPPYECSLVAKDGRIINVIIATKLMNYGGKKAILGIVTDITERIRLQHEALRAAHLASVGELAAGIAHEINNPANSIINYAQMILDETAPESRQSHIAAEVMHEGERIARIVKNMLSFSHHREDDLSYVSVGHVLADSISLIESQLKKLNASIEVDIPDGLPDIFLDPHKLHQVFVNILNNAWHALSVKGPDGIRSLSIKAVPVEGGRKVRISFRDSGAGIRPEYMDKVFAPFFTTKPSGVGTGLGLSISQSIVKSFGGDISIRSEEGRFTEVVVELPAGGRG